MTDVSSTRLYLGNLPRTATKSDVEAHFAQHGTGKITEVKLMNGFGFIEYDDPMDARDVVPAYHGKQFMGERLTVQFARGPRHRDGGPGGFAAGGERNPPPRPRRTPHRMQITGLPSDTSWQDLKDFARQSGLDVVYSETGRNGNGEGFVEFETGEDLTTAVEKLDQREFKDKVVTCVANTQPDMPARDYSRRSRSPVGRRPHVQPRDDFDRRAPPRNGGYVSPRRDGYRDGGYRDRSPRRDYYEERPRYGSPPRRGPIEDYQPRPRPYEDPYRRDYPPDPYTSRGSDYGRMPRDFPRDGSGYPRDPAYGRDYEPRPRY